MPDILGRDSPIASVADPGGFLGKPDDTSIEAAQIASEAALAGTQELRRQFDVTQANIDPFIRAGTGALGGLVEGTTAGGLDERLGRIFDSDIFGNLVQERTRAVEGGLAAGGLTRSGFGVGELAKVPQDIGLAIEQLLTGRLSNLAVSGQNAAVGLGGLGSTASQGIANLTSQAGQNIASGLIGQGQAEAAQQQQTLQIAATAASIFFSDPALKDNVEEIAKIHDLTLCQWDWIEEAGDIIKECGTIGFLADEVKEKYPKHVGEYGGFMVIDYPSLLNELGEM